VDQSVLAQAAGRFLLAERAFEALCQAGEDQDTFQTHWLDFLIQWKGAYTKVQQAAKDNVQEKQWFGAVTGERKADPLLRYLFEARNDGEHGTAYSARHAGPHIGFLSTSAIIRFRFNADGSPFLKPDGKPLVIDDEDNEIEQISTFPAESYLIEVKEYDGKKTVPPPTSHLGKSMEPKPHIAADLGLKWLRSLIVVAEAMLEPWQYRSLS
jgi:hypothetical protein